MKSCATCAHWAPKTSGARSELLALGECHANPPTRDFAWPRTKANDYCSDHAAELPAAARKARPAPKATLPQPT